MSAADPLHVRKFSAGRWHAIFDNPPTNMFDLALFASLRALIDEIEHDEQARVGVFESAAPSYFISHLDVDRLSDASAGRGGAKLADEWRHFVAPLSPSPTVTDP